MAPGRWAPDGKVGLERKKKRPKLKGHSERQVIRMHSWKNYKHTFKTNYKETFRDTL